jgi:hypothetical protein
MQTFFKTFCYDFEFVQSFNPDILCWLSVPIHEGHRFVSVSTIYLLDFGIFSPVWCFDLNFLFNIL